MNDRTLTNSRGRSMSQLVERAFRHWEARRRVAEGLYNLSSRTSTAFSITLARETGTLGSSVAEEVGKLLGWNVYDHELLEHIAKEMGLRTSLLESVDERQQSWLLELAEAFTSMPTKGEWGEFVDEGSFVHHLVQTVLALGVHGECVIVGRGAGFILPDATTLRVRLIAPLRDRIAALSRTMGVAEKEAARQVRIKDRQRTDFVRDHFLKDPRDPHNYDLVLNVSRLSAHKNAEIIVEALHRLQASVAEKKSV